MSAFVQHTPIERLLAVTPLGIRFWDAASETQVDGGLVVTAWPVVDESLPAAFGRSVSTAYRSVSGIYAFRDLPGLRSYEYPSEITPAPILPASIPEQRTFSVEVRDLKRRFVDVTFEIDLPLSERGVYPTAVNGSTPDDVLPGFYLFSAASRSPVPGMAVLRANLTDEASRAPAAHAVLDVEVDGRPWIGLADEQGRTAVMFPYPALTVALTGSFPEGGTPLHEHEWDMTVRIRYDPDRLQVPRGTTRPTLQSILAQPTGLIYSVEPDSSPESDPAESMTATLRFGEEAVLRTQTRSELLVQPTTSIP